MFQVVGSTFGIETTKDIETIVENFMALDSTWLITVGSSLFFLFVGTTLLTVVKKAIHKLWHIRSKPEWHLRYFGWERGTAVGIIFVTGLLILFSIPFRFTRSILAPFRFSLLNCIRSWISFSSRK